jgi:hypothetical protein
LPNHDIISSYRAIGNLSSDNPEIKHISNKKKFINKTLELNLKGKLFFLQKIIMKRIQMISIQFMEKNAKNAIN